MPIFLGVITPLRQFLWRDHTNMPNFWRDRAMKMAIAKRKLLS